MHANHVVTAAQAEAASRAIEVMLDGEPQSDPFQVLVHQSAAEMLRAVPPEAASSDAPTGYRTGVNARGLPSDPIPRVSR